MAHNILITGAAGFIGYHLSKKLLDTGGHELALTLLDNLQRGRLDADMNALLTDSRVRFLQVDLTDQSIYKQLGRGYDHVYHLAAVNGTKWFYKIPNEVLRINVLSLVYILEWIKSLPKKPKLCFTSSNEAYAGALEAFNQLPIPTPENVPLVVSDIYNPRWTYGGTKLIGEQFVIFYAQVHQFPAVIVRPHNFYGPRAGYDHVLPEWCEKIHQRQDPFVLYSPEETRTFCYITDAVQAMQMLMDSSTTDGSPVETVHIGNIDEVTMSELSEKLFAVAGWHPQNLDIKPSPPGSVKRRLADIAKIKQLIGWEPTTTLEVGLQKTWEWYGAHPRPRS